MCWELLQANPVVAATWFCFTEENDWIGKTSCLNKYFGEDLKKFFLDTTEKP